MTLQQPESGESREPLEKTKPTSNVRLTLQRSAPGLILAVILVIALVIGYALIVGSDDPVVLEGPRTRAIQLDVRNGTGVPGLAQKVTSYLRSKGFDVVEIGNADSLGLEKTVVLDRAGNTEAARRVASALGLDDSRVLVRIDRTLYLDVSVYLGTDLRSFTPSR